jgi:hypothetical protein
MVLSKFESNSRVTDAANKHGLIEEFGELPEWDPWR